MKTLCNYSSVSLSGTNVFAPVFHQTTTLMLHMEDEFHFLPQLFPIGTKILIYSCFLKKKLNLLYSVELSELHKLLFSNNKNIL